MIIKKVALGDSKEAFIEDRFISGFNIISSDDNNKGKTILIQSMMFALGNDPVFPSSFDYKEYYHLCVFEEKEREYSVLRKDNVFLVKVGEEMIVFDNLSSYKHFFSENISKIPHIMKDGIDKLIDPVLFFQLFFVGQDNRNTSALIGTSYYKKEDYSNMIYNYCNPDTLLISDKEIYELKRKLKQLNQDYDNTKKCFDIRKKVSHESIVFSSSDLEQFEIISKKIESFKTIIVELKKKRNRLVNRKMKQESLLDELTSLSRKQTIGHLKCRNCNSTDIDYEVNNSLSFDLSDKDTRNQILNSLLENISALSIEIESINEQIRKSQMKIQESLIVDDVDVESLLLYNIDMKTASEYDEKLFTLKMNIHEIKQKLSEMVNKQSLSKEKRKKTIDSIILEMKKFYKDIDPDGNCDISDLFSKNGKTYSGSEESEFYLSKLFGILKITNHPYPIIIDCFRDGELSSSKERIAIDNFSNFQNQKIFTVTLKNEECNKYEVYDSVNNIDYSDNPSSHMLSTKYLSEFNELLIDFKVKMN